MELQGLRLHESEGGTSPSEHSSVVIACVSPLLYVCGSFQNFCKSMDFQKFSVGEGRVMTGVCGFVYLWCVVAVLCSFVCLWCYDRLV